MTPEQWKALSEAEKDVWRQRFEDERRGLYTRPRGDFQKGLIFWAAGDVYMALKACVWFCALFIGGCVLLLALSGCADSAYWWQRTAFNIDCRQGHLQSNGQCTPLKK